MLTDYCYPAVCSPEGTAINIFFPDIDEAYTFVNDEKEIAKNAREVLELSIEGRIEDKIEIPDPRSIKDIKLKDGEYVILVNALIDNKVRYIKKTLTIPEHLNKKALLRNINFSKVLTEALEETLKVK
jgi:predicted RNase H-like HicB family nuclease